MTVFSAPKPFTDPHIAVIQHNALGSWKALGPSVSVALVGSEAGMCEAAAEHGVPQFDDVRRSPEGTPLVSSIFELGREAADSPYMAYINGDIVLFPDLLEAVDCLEALLPDRPFLMIGRRWDLDVTERLDFSDGWEQRLRDEVARRGVLHRPAGSDYFVYPRSAFADVPDFAIGRAGWDNWMIYHARRMGWPVIDGTPSVTIIHQSHDYSHLPGGRPHYDHEESRKNMALAGGLAAMYMVLDSTHELRDGELRRPALDRMRLVRAIERTLMPPDGRLRGPRGALARKFRRMRRNLYG